MERSRKKKIIVAFYGFLILMWLCTVISKSIYTSKLPVVSTETLQAKYIEHTVETEGIVVAGDKSPVNVLPGLRVDGIAVQAGDTVEEGDVILQADLADLDDYIKTQQTQIDKLQAQIDVLLQNRELAQQEKALEEQRAREDYDALARREDTLVGRSDEAYSQAAYELEQYRREMAAQESSPDEDEEEAARKAKEAEAQEAALVDELQQAAYAQADAKWQRDQAMQEAQRKVEDILSPDGEDAAMEVYRLEMAELQDGLEQYRALRDEEGQIREILAAVYPAELEMARWPFAYARTEEDYSVYITFKRDSAYPYARDCNSVYYLFGQGQVPEAVDRALDRAALQTAGGAGASGTEEWVWNMTTP